MSVPCHKAATAVAVTIYLPAYVTASLSPLPASAAGTNAVERLKAGRTQ